MARLAWIMCAQVKSFFDVDPKSWTRGIENCPPASCSPLIWRVLVPEVMPAEFVVSFFLWVIVDAFTANDIAGHG